MEKVIINVWKTPSGYCAGTDILPGWAVAADTFGELKQDVVDGIQFYMDCGKKDGEGYPPVLDGEYELVYQFNIESLLCFYEGIFTMAALERVTGIKQRQLGNYARGVHKPRPAKEKEIKTALRALGEELLAISV
jgi:hypothetical protein